MKKLNKYYKQPDFEDIIDQLDDDEFEIGQCYAEEPVKKFKCKKCGSTEFMVGSEEYFTAIKCPKCLWEICVHDG
jgi:hypothetical protein